ncbi:MAG: glycosyl transferase [Phycisphaerales bacterium]|nr:MAG: glycosyl transferase [Phycisphaerales bacterium]
MGLRGGERVLDRIAVVAEELGRVQALLTMFDDRRPLTPALDDLPRIVSWLGRTPGSLALRRWLLPLYPAAVGQLSERLARLHHQQRIDLLISTSSAAIKGLRPPPGVAHLCYCHSPARYLWSQTDQYGQGLAGLGLRLAGPALRAWDRQTAAHVTTFLANSRHVAELIDQAFGRPARVVYPPVRTDWFTPDPATPRGEHWLAVGALEPYKRFDLAIEAARLARTPLRIVGDGSARRALQRIAPDHVRFLGRLGDEQLREQMRSASVLLFPQIEDFGITAAEAQACGLPVAARNKGGAAEIVLDGQTGALCDGSPAELAHAARRAQRCDPAGCVANAQRFAQDRFDRQIRGVILEHLP